MTSKIDPLWHYSPVVRARPLGGHRVWLRFEDGLEGEVDLGSELWGEILGPLQDPALFARLKVDHTLCWPNGADISPEYLWDRVRFEKLGIRPARRYYNGFPRSKPPNQRKVRSRARRPTKRAAKRAAPNKRGARR